MYSGNSPYITIAKEAVFFTYNGTATDKTDLLKYGNTFTATIYEEKYISYNTEDFNKKSRITANFDLLYKDGTTFIEAKIINEEPEPEEPTPEEPTDPETPSNQIDYTEQIKEVNTNLEEIKNINNSIIIIMCIYIIYDFTRRMFRN